MDQKQTAVDWDDYRLFLAIARSPSFRAAAANLGVSHSTLIRRLNRLERALQTRLFDRLGQKLVLTAAGQELLVGVREIEESVQGIDRMMFGRDTELSGLVRISMPEFFAHDALLFDLPTFQRKFPNIQLEIELSYNAADLKRREADIAIRCTNSEPLDLVGRRVGTLQMAAYSTTEYALMSEPYEVDSSAKTLAWGMPAEWKARHGLDHLIPTGYFDSIPLQISFAKQGSGVASLPCMLADRIPELDRISEPIELADIWILYHSDLRNMSRVTAVRDFFFEHLKSQVNDLKSAR